MITIKTNFTSEYGVTAGSYCSMGWKHDVWENRSRNKLFFHTSLISQSWLPLILDRRFSVTLKASKIAALVILPIHPVKFTLTFVAQIIPVLV